MAQSEKEKTESRCIKIMQINAGRAAKTNAEIRYHVDRDDIQIAMIQEPYTVRGQISSYGGQARVITGAKDGARPWSTIIVFDCALTIMKLSQYCDTHIVCIQVERVGFSFYVVSAYFQFSTPIQPYLQRIREIAHGLRGQKIIFCMDANAKSPMWHSQTLDEEGIMVEDLIQELGLQIINEGDNLSTFYTVHAESNIDVTLATNPATNYIGRWKVREDWISSDHRAITFDVTPERERNSDMDRPNIIRFQTKKANWDKFNQKLREKIKNKRDDPCENSRDVVRLTKNIRRTIIETCKETIPLKRKGKHTTRWWNQELTTLKKSVYRKRKIYQKARKRGNEQIINDKRRLYYEARKEYDRKVKETRNKSWKDFINQGATDPWGFAYKLCCHKLRGQTVINSISNEQEQAINWRESAGMLLDELFGNDTEENDTREQARRRAEMNNMDLSPLCEEEAPFAKNELDKVIRKMKTGKAPGWDAIEVQVLKTAWENNSCTFLRLYNAVLLVT